MMTFINSISQTKNLLFIFIIHLIINIICTAVYSSYILYLCITCISLTTILHYIIIKYISNLPTKFVCTPPMPIEYSSPHSSPHPHSNTTIILSPPQPRYPHPNLIILLSPPKPEYPLITTQTSISSHHHPNPNILSSPPKP